MKTLIAIAFSGLVSGSLVGCAHKQAAKTDPAASQPMPAPAPEATPSSEPVNRPPPN